MNLNQNASSITVEKILADPGVVRILRSTATRCKIEWEDLRQTLALQLLEKNLNLTVLPVRLDLLRTEIKSIAINLYRREPQGRLDRLGERRRRERSDATSDRVSKSRVTCMSLGFDHEDKRRPIEEVHSRLFVEETICRVPPRSRDVFQKRIINDMSFGEIATHTGKRLEQIKSQWRRHSAIIRELVEKELI